MLLNDAINNIVFTRIISINRTKITCKLDSRLFLTCYSTGVCCSEWILNFKIDRVEFLLFSYTYFVWKPNIFIVEQKHNDVYHKIVIIRREKEKSAGEI